MLQQVDDPLADALAGGCGDEGSAVGADLDGHHAVGFQTRATPPARSTRLTPNLLAEIPFRGQAVSRLELLRP